VAGASTTVTRSIGDWDAARCVLPEPELATWTLPSDLFFERVVLATDGLWDVLTDARAVQRIVFRHDDPQAVADALMEAARAASIKKFQTPHKDDTTVVVVDLKSLHDVSRPRTRPRWLPCSSS